MADDVLIRDVRPEDVETLAEMAVAAWEPIYANRRRMLGDELFEALHSDWRRRKAQQARSACAAGSRTRVCVAEREGRPVGFITFSADEASRVGHIENTAVHPAFQGRGLGTRMVRHACERLKEQGMRFAMVGTGGDEAHAPARRSYEKAGFDIQLPILHYYREL